MTFAIWLPISEIAVRQNCTVCLIAFQQERRSIIIGSHRSGLKSKEVEAAWVEQVFQVTFLSAKESSIRKGISFIAAFIETCTTCFVRQRVIFSPYRTVISCFSSSTCAKYVDLNFGTNQTFADWSAPDTIQFPK